jgi:hypothetical protein
MTFKIHNPQKIKRFLWITTFLLLSNACNNAFYKNLALHYSILAFQNNAIPIFNAKAFRIDDPFKVLEKSEIGDDSIYIYPKSIAKGKFFLVSKGIKLPVFVAIYLPPLPEPIIYKVLPTF